MDQIQITSCFSGDTWSGELDMPGDTPEAKLESIFLFFNRINDGDAERLRDLDFNQPSVSAGDRVTLNGTAYRCDSLGWSEDDDPEGELSPLMPFLGGKP